ncbi:MAG: alanine racemase [Clostridium sp.]|nr:alanine racemase [Clostridium sp.]
MPALFIDEDILKNNIEITKKLSGEAHVIGVVKGNGYGLGLCEFARILVDTGIETLAVTEVKDAVALRNSGIRCDILMLSPLYQKEDIITALKQYLILSITSCECGEMAEQTAAELNIYARCQIYVDTGLGRYGFTDNQKRDIIYTINQMKHLCVTGIYSHFYAASCKKPVHTVRQFERFTSLCDEIEQANVFIGFRHIAASCALLRYPETRLDAVRIGSAFLGRLPFPHHLGYQPVGQLQASIEDIRVLAPGTGLGYGHSYMTSRQTKIAVISAGYAHGLGIRRYNNCPGLPHLAGYILRTLKNILFPEKLYAYSGETQLPILGKIGMNSTIIDITGTNLAIGDTVLIPVNPIYVDSSLPRQYGQKPQLSSLSPQRLNRT